MRPTWKCRARTLPTFRTTNNNGYKIRGRGDDAGNCWIIYESLADGEEIHLHLYMPKSRYGLGFHFKNNNPIPKTLHAEEKIILKTYFKNNQLKSCDDCLYKYEYKLTKTCENIYLNKNAHTNNPMSD